MSVLPKTSHQETPQNTIKVPHLCSLIAAQCAMATGILQSSQIPFILQVIAPRLSRINELLIQNLELSFLYSFFRRLLTYSSKETPFQEMARGTGSPGEQVQSTNCPRSECAGVSETKEPTFPS